MADEIKPVTDDAAKTVGTPEGDNEFAPDQPVGGVVDGLQTPRGGETSGTATAEYKKDE